MNILDSTPVLVDPDPTALTVAVLDEELRIDLSDGRALFVPLAWFPRLREATIAQRTRWHLIVKGHGIHWPDVDEDISVRALLGRPS